MARRSPAELTLLLTWVPSNENLLKHSETISKAKLLFFMFCCWKLSLWNNNLFLKMPCLFTARFPNFVKV